MIEELISKSHIDNTDQQATLFTRISVQNGSLYMR